MTVAESKTWSSLLRTLIEHKDLFAENAAAVITSGTLTIGNPVREAIRAAEEVSSDTYRQPVAGSASDRGRM